MPAGLTSASHFLLPAAVIWIFLVTGIWSSSSGKRESLSCLHHGLSLMFVISDFQHIPGTLFVSQKVWILFWALQKVWSLDMLILGNVYLSEIPLSCTELFPSVNFFFQSLRITEKAEDLQNCLSWFCAHFSFSISRYFPNDDVTGSSVCQPGGQWRGTQAGPNTHGHKSWLSQWPAEPLRQDTSPPCMVVLSPPCSSLP